MEHREQPSQNQSHPMRRKDDRVLTQAAEIKGISDEDKQEIYENIDRVVENNRIPITEELLTLKPTKKGAAFPVTINIIAIAAVGAAFFLSAMFFEQRQEALSLETEQYLSTEGKLIEQLKKESEEALKAKDEQIGQIQDELAELDRKSAELQANMQDTIREREAELRAELEEALEAERARLQEMGTSAEDIESQLAQFEEERRQQFENELQSFRAEAEAEIRAKEEELEQARALNRDYLAQMNAEKAELQEELNRREEELSAQFEAEKAALEQETSEAREKLAALAAQSESEQLFIDQLTSGYLGVKQNIENENYTAALQGITALENLLNDPSVASLSGLAKRREAERFILDTLKKDIEARTYKEDTDTASMVQAAEALLSAKEIAQRGTAAFEAGNTAEARDYYTRAIASLPSIDRAYRDLESLQRQENAETLTGGISGAETLLETGDYSGAVERLRTAILSAETGTPELYEEAVRGIEDAMARQRRTALAQKDRELAEVTEQQQEELETLKTELQAEIASLQETVEALNSTIAEQEEALAEAEESLTAAAAEHQAAMEELEALHAEELAELEASYQEQLAEQETGYETRLTEQETAYEEQLAELQTTYDELLAEKEAEAEAYEERIKGLTTDIKAAGEEIAGLRTIRAVYEELTDDYLEYKARIEQLLGSNRTEDARQAENLYREFLGDEAETLFPDLAELSRDVTEIALREAEREAVSEGRKAAFEDVMLYTDYMSTTLSGGVSGSKEEIADLSRAEPEYGDTILEIQQLVEEAGATAAASDDTLFRQARFIGTVSYIIGDKIVIERLIAFEAETGDSLLIKRKTRSGRDETLAEASISRITAQKVEATIDSLSGEEKPAVMDLVYLVTE